MRLSKQTTHILQSEDGKRLTVRDLLQWLSSLPAEADSSPIGFYEPGASWSMHCPKVSVTISEEVA